MAHLDPSLRCPLIGGLLRLWSTWDKRLMRGSAPVTSSKTRTCVSGKATVLITSMTRIAHRKLFTKRQPNPQFNQSWKVITPLSWHMVKQGPVKHTLWKVSGIMAVTQVGVSSQDLWRKFFTTSRCNQTKTLRSWSAPVTYRSIMRSSLTS